MKKKLEELEKRVERLERERSISITLNPPPVVDQRWETCRWCGGKVPCGQFHYIA